MKTVPKFVRLLCSKSRNPTMARHRFRNLKMWQRGDWHEQQTIRQLDESRLHTKKRIMILQRRFMAKILHKYGYD